jgi:hypothetical protein
VNRIHPPQLRTLLILLRDAVTRIEDNKPSQPVFEQEVLVVVSDFLEAIPDGVLKPVLQPVRRIVLPAATADIQISWQRRDSRVKFYV